jgi:hypothetical protein
LSGAAADADLDLFVYNGAFRVGFSAVEGSNEEVTLTNPGAATYTVYVHGFDVNGSTNFTLHSWVIGQAEGNVTITAAPGAAAIGATASIGLSFADTLLPGTSYLGTVSYSGVPTLTTPTIVRVDVPAGQ